MRKIMVWILIVIICFTALTLVGCAQEGGTGSTGGTAEPTGDITVLAKIEEVNGTQLLVRGLTEGFTGIYSLSTEGAIVCMADGTKIYTELCAGDTVRITYSGIIMESYPGILADVSVIAKT